MSNSALSITVIAAVLCCATACKSNQTEQKAEEKKQEKAEGQKQESKEAAPEQKKQGQAQEAGSEAGGQDQIGDVEKRYQELETKAEAALKKLDASSGLGAEIQQLRTQAKAKLDEARNATSEDLIQPALKAAKDALDKLDSKLGDVH